MFKLHTTIDDSSPLIIYSPAGYWAQGSMAEDPELTKFWRESYTYTWNAGASASFTFNGTGIKILGTTRSANGSYTVNLDGQSKILDATAPDPMEYQADVVLDVTGLQQKQHTVTVTNADASVYIDCVGSLLRHSQVLELHVCQQIHWWGTVGSGELQNRSSELNDDTDSKFLWHPADAWSNPPSNISQFSNGTGQFVTFPLFYALRLIKLQLYVSGRGISQLQFLSDAISVFGTSGPQNGNYTVRLDDIVSWPFSAKRATYETRVLLFQADNLGDGAHTLSLVNGDEGGLLEIDYALSYTDPLRSPPESSPNSGAAAAIAVASVAFITLLVVIWLLLRRNKTLWTRLQNGYMVQSQYDWHYPSARGINAVSTAGNDSVFAGTTNDIEARNVTLQGNHHHRPLVSETQLIPNIPNNIQPPPLGQRSLRPTRPTDVRRPEPVRSSTILTASTLVAENGSNVSNSRAMKVMIQLTALRESSSAIQSRVSDSQTPLLTNSNEPSSLPGVKDHTAAVDRDDLFDEIDSLLNKFDLGGRPLSTDSQSPRYWQATRSAGRP
ncbi:uncharacterized protein ARMOST_14730 [Armillaria ostoyae]|uniref:Uncharacterized protein n=1 Tax=Armillaria ostoyae TaxID=47428 RepID=A0A284RRD8_ARMOS|nr:uncharacterized protein ARMOST_14730 [Armillaria ostoyae]